MSLRDTGRPAQPRLAALEASRRDLCRRGGKASACLTTRVMFMAGRALATQTGGRGEDA